MSARTRRMVLAAGALVLVLVVATAGAFAFDRRERSGGPLNVAVSDSVGAPAKAGQVSVSGPTVVFNSGDQPAVITSIRPLMRFSNFEVLGVAAQLKGRVNESFCCMVRWPVAQADRVFVNPQQLRHLPVTLPPDGDRSAINAGLNIVWTTRAPGPGRYGFRAVELKYTVGRKHYRRVFGSPLMACVPGQPREPCDLFHPPTDAELAKL